ncbi:MAG: hypothetical protein K5886_00435 [Lachnospiraceae bacterium]|nr:hypothetical protein [Lachnospiraceae bacterium]
MFKCKNCSGDLVLDVKGSTLKCPFCGSTFPVSEYDAMDEVKEQEGFGDDTYETTIYTCTTCGAELSSTDSTAVTFCSYCGTQAILEGRLSRERKPKYIVPFIKTKEECKKIYSENAKKEPYAPKEFTDPAFLEGFRGIYMPYWELNVGFDNDPSLTVVERYTSGNYDYTDTYNVQPKIRKLTVPVPRDASSAFDDEIASEIAPFHKEKMKEFNPAFLAGFFTDTADVDSSVYREQAINAAEDLVISNVKKDFRTGASISLPTDLNQRNAIFGAKIKEAHLNLFPVWFLTWRKGDRLAYGVINGENGKLSAEIPVDIKKYLSVSGIIALILFILANILSLLVLPHFLLQLASCAAVIIQFFYCKEIISVRDRETHANDIGSLKGDDQKKARLDFIRGKGKAKGMGMTIVMLAAVIVSISLSIANGFKPANALGGCFFTLAAGIVLLIMTLKPMLSVKEKRMIPIGLMPVAAEFTAFVILSTHTIADWKIYGGCIVSLLVLLVVSLSMINDYNLLTTRSIPEFHNRKGGNRDAG